MSSHNIKKYVYIAIGVIVAILLFYFILPVSLPIILALITALFLSPAVKALVKSAKLSRNIAVFIVFVLFLLFIAMLGYFTFTRALSQLNQFVENLPAIINEINITWMSLLENLRMQFDHLSQDIVNEIDAAVTSQLLTMRDTLQEINIVGYATSVLVKIPSYIVSFLVYLIALYLFLLDIPRLKLKVFSYMSDKTAEKVSFMSARLSYVIFGFFKAQFLVSIIIFIVTLIGLLFIAPEVALIMSIFIWMIDFIPIIGSIAVLAPWAGYHLIAGNTVLAIQLLVLAAILLTIRRTVEPKVMGHHIGLSPLATLISLYIGLMLFGAVGFVLGPLVVILFTSAKEAGIIKVNFKV
ncbi:sporulation integral membrane protein YtvI [Salipaludibacillus agaradhaerens]|uniref:Sporulation integral membrane protein YtvI n=1 Tax=Salipaludibacillus agaradhaerens TaxID=76935 RepID=A0A9Q4B037_SALAG|nr:sporulation integral membrane protein YtvI [Salipaludibacillus agaradhaerens]MCR6095916.1 sporulation integral membrane protein YtvI [Salipaludibacillus agaradhaerens]MCR6114525.1 sporulation integral membrane protein YtvI [Salipaludibacillus agaradhaerens]